MSMTFEMLLILGICVGMALTAFAFAGWVIWKIRRSDKESAERSEQMVKAMEALLDQDSPMIRELMRP